ncbi:MAG: hypothetical protein WC319_05005 [Candidatus Paceibacterota bacterium]|jgi:hypothetical protein
MNAVEIKKRIKERKKNIKLVIFLVGEIVEKYRAGSIVQEKKENSYTHIVYEFEFGGFFFRASYNECMVGGNTFTIWDGPQKSGEPVLLFYYQSDMDKDGRVDAFSNNQEWWLQIQDIFMRRHDIAKQERRREDDPDKGARLKAEEAKGLAELQKEAERWKV